MYHRAITACEKRLYQDPYDANAWLSKGKIQNKLKLYVEAMGSFDAAIEYGSDLPEAWYGICHARLQMEKYQEAIKACDEALRLRPNYSEAKQAKDQAVRGLKGQRSR